MQETTISRLKQCACQTYAIKTKTINRNERKKEKNSKIRTNWNCINATLSDRSPHINSIVQKTYPILHFSSHLSTIKKQSQIGPRCAAMKTQSLNRCPRTQIHKNPKPQRLNRDCSIREWKCLSVIPVRRDVWSHTMVGVSKERPPGVDVVSRLNFRPLNFVRQKPHLFLSPPPPSLPPSSPLG